METIAVEFTTDRRAETLAGRCVGRELTVPGLTASGLGQVRRMEAVAFRALPSATTHFDGTWAIRLTAGHPAKRLNSVNPLDPGDTAHLEERIETVRRRFEAYGKPLLFRNSPLAPPELERLLDARGWSRFEESVVMTGDLAAMPLGEAVDRVPLQDIGRWVATLIDLGAETKDHAAGLFEVVSRIEAETGLFAAHDETGRPIAALRCVRDDELAGIFDLATRTDCRRQGHGAAILASALKWAAGRGARTAWLQVVAENDAALALYRKFGFGELYRYVYRGAPQ